MIMFLGDFKIRNQKQINAILYPLVEGYAWEIKEHATKYTPYSLNIVHINSNEIVKSSYIRKKHITINELTRARNAIFHKVNMLRLIENFSFIPDKPEVGNYVYSEKENKNIWVSNVDSIAFDDMRQRNIIADALPVINNKYYWSVRKYIGSRPYRLALLHSANDEVMLDSWWTLHDVKKSTIVRQTSFLARKYEHFFNDNEIKNNTKQIIQKSNKDLTLVGFYINKKMLKNKKEGSHV